MSSGTAPEGEVFRDKTKSKWAQKKVSEMPPKRAGTCWKYPLCVMPSSSEHPSPSSIVTHPCAGMCPLIVCSLLGTSTLLSWVPALAPVPIGLRYD